MAPPTPRHDDGRWRAAGERMETLIDGIGASGAAARARAENLVREVTDLYGAALERMTDLAVTAKPELAQEFADDDLIASLLLVHGLHPHGVERRVADALAGVRPYLGSHGGDVSLLGVTDGVVRLQLLGSCKTCPSSSATLELAVQDAVRAAAPDIEAIEVVAAEPDPGSAMIPASSLMSRVRAAGGPARWIPVPQLTELVEGEIGGFRVEDMSALVCRVGGSVFAYRDRCPACAGSLAGAALTGAVLHCPGCGAGFDVVHAGCGVGGDGHLQPIPVLERSGVLSLAVSAPAEVA
ncbi:NifU family protein [Mycobacterium sp. ITM-2016-00317]|uniref:NifU family protein n=1 Tax=Mycobacterium sp. ITM-2016-00317 TaxID=2099694 RepID=UPI00287F550A|nr:NifU family protein [Mycobacterium sp. ITM-2016-00317]WNG89649.1 NifU family protein [Mycobacterium sp. ITM-2016-00317]